MIKSKTVYTTTDGKTHETREIALKHEAAFKVKSGFEQKFIELAPSRMPSEFSINLLNNPTALIALRDLANKGLEYHRNYGKLKKASKTPSV